MKISNEKIMDGNEQNKFINLRKSTMNDLNTRDQPKRISNLRKLSKLSNSPLTQNETALKIFWFSKGEEKPSINMAKILDATFLNLASNNPKNISIVDHILS